MDYWSTRNNESGGKWTVQKGVSARTSGLPTLFFSNLPRTFEDKISLGEREWSWPASLTILGEL